VASPRVAIFAYGSLASIASAERTLGRPVEHAAPARLPGWRRRWSTVRDNLSAEKTFARPGDGSLPPYCLGLNLERAEGPAPNGVLVEATEAELERLDRRELRYQRVDVSGEVAGADPHPFGRIVTFTARAENFAPSPPPGAVIIASYARTVEAAFGALGPGQLDLFRETTGPCPVEVVDAVLVRDRIPQGNPREW
jgi:cation transport regulator ChaC